MYLARTIALFTGLLCSAHSLAEWHYEKQAIMGTEVHLQFWHEDKNRAKAITAEVMGEFHRIDAALSPYKEDSELSRVNREAGQGAVPVTEELASIVDKSLWYSDKTAGAFDITYATLGSLYDFRRGQQAGEEITETLLPAVNYRHIHLNREQLDGKRPTLVFSDPRTKIDLGGIAKGYAVDRAVAILQQHGVGNASVSAGGDARLLGDKRGKPWLIGIRHPRDKSKNAAVIPLEATAISTSGDYERFFIDDDDHRVHHIFDPATGKPAETDSRGDAADSDKLISVSVIGPRGFDTDPLSTSVFVLGKHRGMALIEELNGFEAVVIDANHRMFFTNGLQQ